jgi:hypothetical protein
MLGMQRVARAACSPSSQWHQAVFCINQLARLGGRDRASCNIRHEHAASPATDLPFLLPPLESFLSHPYGDVAGETDGSNRSQMLPFTKSLSTMLTRKYESWISRSSLADWLPSS